MKPTYLGSAHESTEEYPFKRPLGFGNGDVRFRPSDVDRRDEEGGYRTLGTTDDRVYEMSELQVGVVPVGQTTSLGRGPVAEAMLDYANGGVDEIVNDAS